MYFKVEKRPCVSCGAMVPEYKGLEDHAKDCALALEWWGRKAQHQGSLYDQLCELVQLANNNGLYDASDYLQKLIERS